jgi:translation elongation factor EF-4
MAINKVTNNKVTKKVTEKKAEKPAPRYKEKLPRTHAHVFLLNDREEKALNRFLEQYKIKNTSKFIRETLMLRIISKFEEDHPTLF